MKHADPLRRALLRGFTAGLLAPVLGHARAGDDAHRAALERLEHRAGGRLGVCVYDPTAGATLDWRTDERFAMCSTFKLLLAAVVLREADAGRLSLDEELSFGREDLVPHAPVIERKLDAGRMSLVALAEATQTTSDNVAANLLIRRLGGPTAVTAAFRALGDDTTRIDRYEPAMNRVKPGDVRDTTTPAAIARTAARVFDGGLLSDAAQQRLRGWMIATQTGLRRLRAGLPADWTVGDKTGTGSNPETGNQHNDVAVVWRAGAATLAIAAYYEVGAYYPDTRAQDDAVLAEVGRIAAKWVTSRG